MGCGASSAKNVEDQQPVESNEKRIEVAKKHKEEEVSPVAEQTKEVQKVEKPIPKEEVKEKAPHREEEQHASLPPKKVKQKEKEEDDKPVVPHNTPEPPNIKNPGEEEENFDNVEYGEEEHRAATVIQEGPGCQKVAV